MGSQFLLLPLAYSVRAETTKAVGSCSNRTKAAEAVEAAAEAAEAAKLLEYIQTPPLVLSAAISTKPRPIFSASTQRGNRAFCLWIKAPHGVIMSCVGAISEAILT